MTSIAIPPDETTANRCPVTGLPVECKPGWADIQINQHYSASFAVIGGHILHSKARGHSGSRGITLFMEERERVLREAGIWNRPYVEIKDYESVPSDHPRVGRVQFTMAMVAEGRRGNLRGFWGYNGTTSLSNILSVAKRLVRHRGIPVAFVPDYEKAVLHAECELRRCGVPMERPWREELHTREGWRLELPGLSASFGVIGTDIMLVEVQGRLRARHLEPFMKLRHQVQAAPGFFPAGKMYRILNLKELEGMTWRARRDWISMDPTIRDPLAEPLTVLVGMNRLMSATMRMSQAVFSGKLVAARDMDEALGLVHEHRLGTATGERTESGTWRVPKIYTEEQVRRIADDLLNYVAAINWEMPGLESAPSDPNNPMAALYEVVAVIKDDFDTMVRQRAEMQSRMFRAAKVASLGTLAAGFAHELNNPLCAVLGFAQRLQEATAEEKSQRYGEIIERAARRMSRLVNQLGDMCREPDLTRVEAVHLNQAVEGVMELLGTVLERQRMEVEVQLEADLPPVMADEGHLQNLVQNLVINARDAMMDRNRKGPRRIVIRTWSDQAWVKLSVEDNGPGMSEEVMEQAFDPFYTTKEVGKGSGLGLYMAHRTVDQYNGSLKVVPREGGGTRFEMQFPSGAGGEERSGGRLP